jgi:small subunit ribosomal protein S12
MAIRHQLAVKGRKQRRRRCKVRIFEGAPHRRGLIYKVTVMSPRKPNSAKRKFAKVRLILNNKRAFCHIPGVGYVGLQEYSVVMVEGKGPPDMPGVNYSLIKGLLNFSPEESFDRKRRRSKFGLKKYDSSR